MASSRCLGAWRQTAGAPSPSVGAFEALTNPGESWSLTRNEQATCARQSTCAACPNLSAVLLTLNLVHQGRKPSSFGSDRDP